MEIFNISDYVKVKYNPMHSNIIEFSQTAPTQNSVKVVYILVCTETYLIKYNEVIFNVTESKNLTRLFK